MVDKINPEMVKYLPELESKGIIVRVASTYHGKLAVI